MITAVEIDELYYAEPIASVTNKATGLSGAEAVSYTNLTLPTT